MRGRGARRPAVTVDVVRRGRRRRCPGTRPTWSSAQCYAAFDDARASRRSGLTLRCTNRIPHGRGLGSSAAAVVAGRAGRPRPRRRRDDSATPALAVATALEGHPDNAAAALLGGLTDRLDDGARRRAPCASSRRLGCAPSSWCPTRARRPRPRAGCCRRPSRTPTRRTPPVGLRCSWRRSPAGPTCCSPRPRTGCTRHYRAPAMPATAALVARLRAAGLAAVVSGAGPERARAPDGAAPSGAGAASRLRGTASGPGLDAALAAPAAPPVTRAPSRRRDPATFAAAGTAPAPMVLRSTSHQTPPTSRVAGCSATTPRSARCPRHVADDDVADTRAISPLRRPSRPRRSTGGGRHEPVDAAPVSTTQNDRGRAAHRTLVDEEGPVSVRQHRSSSTPPLGQRPTDSPADDGQRGQAPASSPPQGHRPVRHGARRAAGPRVRARDQRHGADAQGPADRGHQGAPGRRRRRARRPRPARRPTADADDRHRRAARVDRVGAGREPTPTGRRARPQRRTADPQPAPTSSRPRPTGGGTGTAERARPPAATGTASERGRPAGPPAATASSEPGRPPAGDRQQGDRQQADRPAG